MGTTSVVVIVVVVAYAARGPAATGGQDDDGDARQSVAWPRSTRVQNEGAKPRSPAAGRGCTHPDAPSSLLSSSSLRTTTRTIFFHRSTIRGRVGSRLRSRVQPRWSERASLFVREEKSGDLRVYACVYRLYHMDIFEDVPLAMKKRR